ncbi:MAG: hypothetical protein M1834_005685 [Cirrosporium novae-zelandiae]|nr:MAG: hypothetical protein M1834_005685 [Cirrosporium novae-zelandiae]
MAAEMPQLGETTAITNNPVSFGTDALPKTKARNRNKDGSASAKRRCVSSACTACRKRKSKCDGKTPSCAACLSVYGTECVYDPNSDHRRKGVYKKDIDTLKTHNSTLQTIIQALLNYEEEDVPDLVHQIRSCENLEDVAEAILAKEHGDDGDGQQWEPTLVADSSRPSTPTFEKELSGKMGGLKLENGLVRYIGGTSNLLFLPPDDMNEEPSFADGTWPDSQNPIQIWTTVTSDINLITHLINMYFAWHYQYFTTLSKDLFWRDFLAGTPSNYCNSLLVNAMLALGCHFTSVPGARANPDDSATVGNHFFKEAKRLILENDEHTKPRLANVQALALMSVREAGCGREGSGWFYSGMSFRMACDIGLNVGYDELTAIEDRPLDEREIDARRMTFWGCFLFDKCWSNYLGRQPQLTLSNSTIPKFEVFPSEDSSPWSPYTDSGMAIANSQPCRTRAVALQISALCEISSDLLLYFYHPQSIEKPVGKQAELKRLSEIHTRLEAWRKNLPKELEPKEGQLPNVLLMHMFFHLLFIHLYRPFLKYNRTTSPLPAHVSPRKLCIQGATMISKLMRLYKRIYGLKQICNVADKSAKRDVNHGVKHLEEISESWLCSRRALRVLSSLAINWRIELPDEAAVTLARAEAKYGPFHSASQSPETQISSPPKYTSQSPEAPPAKPLSPSMVAQTSQALPAMNAFNLYFKQNKPTRHPDMYHMTAQLAAEAQQSSSWPNYGSLSQEQRDRWNEHQVSRRSEADSHVSPSVLFGGVDALVEESHNWWMKDQSALAMGLENWTDGEAPIVAGETSMGDGSIGNTNPGNVDGTSGTSATGGSNAQDDNYRGIYTTEGQQYGFDNYKYDDGYYN